MSTAGTICQAIEQMRILEFRYKGTLRTVEPHTLGYSKRGILTLCAWQLAGGSAEAWRDFHVDLIDALALTAEHFDGPRPGYNPCPTTLTNLVCTI
jgi:predicted DNA-binding transcriptional regulator YafY